MIYIGIDPGVTGAMAILFWENDTEPEIYDYQNKFNALSKLKVISETDEPFAIIEKVHAMYKQSAHNTFKFGENFGEWQGILQAFNIPYALIPPKEWQKEIFAPMEDDIYKLGKNGHSQLDRKEMSRQKAISLFPKIQDQLKRKKDHNRADALLITKYCIRYCEIQRRIK